MFIDIFVGSIDEREEDDLCSSNHFILDRIAEKEQSTENLFSSGSTQDDDIDIKQVRCLEKEMKAEEQGRNWVILRGGAGTYIYL